MILACKNNCFFATLSCTFYHMAHQCFSNSLLLELRIHIQSENHLIIAIRIVQRGVMIQRIRQIVGICTAAVTESCNFPLFGFCYKETVLACLIPFDKILIPCCFRRRETQRPLLLLLFSDLPLVPAGSYTLLFVSNTVAVLPQRLPLYHPQTDFSGLPFPAIQSIPCFRLPGRDGNNRAHACSGSFFDLSKNWNAQICASA